MENLQRIKLFDVELEENIHDNDSVLIARPNEESGEIIKVPISSVIEKCAIDAGAVGNTEAKEYGVCYNANTASPTLQRIGAAVGLVAGTGVDDDTNVINDFDNIYPWSEIKRCTRTADGTITSYKGDANYTEDGSIGDVDVELPKFYEKRIVDKNAGYIYRYICKEKLAGYRTPEAFIKNGQEVDKIYISAYCASQIGDALCSVAGVDYLDDNKYLRVDKIRTMMSEKGDNFHSLDLAIMEIIQTLFMIEFATLNCKSVFKGCTDLDISTEYKADSEWFENADNIFSPEQKIDVNEFMVGQELYFYSENPENFNSPENTVVTDGELTYCYTIRKVTEIEIIDEEADEASGATVAAFNITFDGSPIFWDDSLSAFHHISHGCTNAVKASSGELGCYKQGSRPFVWRGLENLYGIDEILIDGVLTQRRKIYVSSNPLAYNVSSSDFQNSEDYHELSYTLSNEDGNILSMGYDENYPWTVLPVDASGTSETGYCDEIKGTKTATVAKRFSTGLGLFNINLSTMSVLNSFAVRLVSY